jgi:hypothetical protein
MDQAPSPRHIRNVEHALKDWLEWTGEGGVFQAAM